MNNACGIPRGGEGSLSSNKIIKQFLFFLVIILVMKSSYVFVLLDKNNNYQSAKVYIAFVFRACKN